MKVTPIVTADIQMPEAYVFRPSGPRALGLAQMLRPGAPKIDAHCLAFVIHHPQRGPILVDTGFHPDATSDRRKDFGLPMSMMFKGLRPAGAPFDEQLRSLGIEPDDVELTIMTHLHVDHTSGMRLLPRSRFVIARREWKAATRKNADRAGFIGHHLPPEERVELVEPDDFDLPGIRLIATPGHTPGHMSVLVEEDDLLIAGDAAYTTRSIAEQRLPLLTSNDDEYARSLSELRNYKTVIPTHDPDAWRRLGAAHATEVAEPRA